jgi:RNA polymerase sigma factor (sigma-70 family)
MRVLPQLSEDRQEVLRLRFLVGLSTAETAVVMGKRRGTVRTLLSRAIDDLRERCLDG